MTVPVAYYVPRDVILAQAEGELKHSDGWAEQHQYEIAQRALNRASALLGLLEVQDCGSVGGFDKRRKQTPPEGTPREKLQLRLEWLRSLPVRQDGS